MFDCGHVLRSVVGAQAHQVVVEDYIQHPVQAVFDPSVGADGAGEEGRVDWQGGKKEAAGAGGFAIAFDLRFDHGDGFQAWETRLAGGAAWRLQPTRVMADPVAAGRLPRQPKPDRRRLRRERYSARASSAGR